MQIQTKRFGSIEIDPSRVISFPKGLIGFSEYRDYTILNLGSRSGPLLWLQSLQEPSLGFVTLSLYDVFPNYNPDYSPSDLSDLGDSPDELVTLSVVTVPSDLRQMTTNLQAPLIINPVTRLGKQVIVTSPEYNTKHYVFTTIETLMKRTG